MNECFFFFKNLESAKPKLKYLNYMHEKTTDNIVYDIIANVNKLYNLRDLIFHAAYLNIFIILIVRNLLDACSRYTSLC